MYIYDKGEMSECGINEQCSSRVYMFCKMSFALYWTGFEILGDTFFFYLSFGKNYFPKYHILSWSFSLDL